MRQIKRSQKKALLRLEDMLKEKQRDLKMTLS